MNIDDECVTVNMKFSGSWESLYIPLECISAMFNDPVKPEFMFSFKHQNAKKEEHEQHHEPEAPAKTEAQESGSNVIAFRPRR